MSYKKYELTDQTKEYMGHTLHRIRALRHINAQGLRVAPGDLGGFIEKEFNLSQDNDCWVADDAMVFDQGIVLQNALVRHTAKVYETGLVAGSVVVWANGRVYGTSVLTGKENIGSDGWVRSSDDCLVISTLKVAYTGVTFYRGITNETPNLLAYWKGFNGSIPDGISWLKEKGASNTAIQEFSQAAKLAHLHIQLD